MIQVRFTPFGELSVLILIECLLHPTYRGTASMVFNEVLNRMEEFCPYI
jgi:hypothetical protein